MPARDSCQRSDAGVRARADINTVSMMAAIVSYIYNELPSRCHGSYAKVDAWIVKYQQERV